VKQNLGIHIAKVEEHHYIKYLKFLDFKFILKINNVKKYINFKYFI